MRISIEVFYFYHFHYIDSVTSEILLRSTMTSVSPLSPVLLSLRMGGCLFLRFLCSQSNRILYLVSFKYVRSNRSTHIY